jgi:hypothetical protein
MPVQEVKDLGHELIKLIEEMRHSHLNIQHTYDCFAERIQQISKQEECSRLDSLQLLARIRETLVQLLENYNDSASLQYMLIRSSLTLVDFEKQMIYLQLKYPGIREIATQRRHSPLKISKRFTNSDLMEVIAALSAVGFFCRQDDSPATFMQITREFETLCNTSFKNPDNCRWAVLNRKNRLTHFLDTLRGTLVELSQK